MCKILVMSHIKNVDNAYKLAFGMSESMSLYNKDGLGYTAVRSDGEIFTERWLNNQDAFVSRPEKMSALRQELAQLGEMIKSTKRIEYSLQGEIGEEITSLMMHTRMATSERGFKNSHPFVDDDNNTSIIHNGIISNHLEFKKLKSTCDSEVFLTEYNRLNIANDFNKVKTLSSSLEGYWVTCITSVDSSGRRVIDLFKSDRSQLSVAFVEEIGGLVFTTDQNDLDEAILDLKWGVTPSYKVVENVFFRFDAITGELIHKMVVPASKPVQRYVTPIGKVSKVNSYPAVVEASDSRYGTLENFHVEENEMEELLELEATLSDAEQDELDEIPHDMRIEYLREYRSSLIRRGNL